MNVSFWVEGYKSPVNGEIVGKSVWIDCVYVRYVGEITPKRTRLLTLRKDHCYTLNMWKSSQKVTKAMVDKGNFNLWLG